MSIYAKCECPSCKAKLEFRLDVSMGVGLSVNEGKHASFGPCYPNGPEAHSVNCPGCDATYIVKGFPPKEGPAEHWTVGWCPFCGLKDPGSIEHVKRVRA